MKVRVHRNVDTLRLRKVVVELHHDTDDFCCDPIDRTRMFAGPFFAWRLARRIARMKARAAVMLAAQ